MTSVFLETSHQEVYTVRGRHSPHRREIAVFVTEPLQPSETRVTTQSTPQSGTSIVAQSVTAINDITMKYHSTPP